jgi:transposase InsO family protein
MPAVIEARILELRRVHAEWGPARIRYALAREHVQPVPGRSSIYRALLRAGVIQARRRRKRKADYKRWERPAPMELWQLDVMGRVFLADQTELKVVTGIDDHSRFCVLAQLVPRATARRVCAAFSEALRRYGLPEEVLTDNGKVFTARFGPRDAETLFDRICRENGISHRLTAVRSPTTTGKVERFHKTLRDEFFSKHTFTTIEEAQQALDSFVEDYNAVRPHQSLGERTPAERFRLRAVEAPEPVVQDPVETSEHAVAPVRPDGGPATGRAPAKGRRQRPDHLRRHPVPSRAVPRRRARRRPDRRRHRSHLPRRRARQSSPPAPLEGEGEGDLEPPSSAEEQERPLGRCQTSGEDDPSSVWWDSTIRGLPGLSLLPSSNAPISASRVTTHSSAGSAGRTVRPSLVAVVSLAHPRAQQNRKALDRGLPLRGRHRYELWRQQPDRSDRGRRLADERPVALSHLP